MRTVRDIGIKPGLWLLTLVFFLRSPLLWADDLSRLPFQAYAQVGAGYTSNSKSVKRDNDGEALHGYSAGSIDFFFNPRLDDHVKTLFEVNLEHNAEGAIETMVERVQLGYAFEDYGTIWLGRFHSPYGFWNTGYHHGSQLQTSLRRPRFLDFDDHGSGVMPSHTVGLWFSGGVKRGDGRFTYDIYTGNGSDIKMGHDSQTLDSNNYMDSNKDKMFGFNLAYNFAGALNGLRAGVHGMQSEVTYTDMDVPPMMSSRTQVRMYGGFAYYDHELVEAIAEYYRFDDRNLYGPTDTLSHRSWAGFIQVAPRLGQVVMPYLRIEEAALDRDDNFFGQQTNGYSYHRQALGLRYDLNMNTALKFEWSHTNSEDADLGQYDEGLFQYAVRF